MTNLSKRLKTVASQITKGNRVADIGCDHAYVSIFLIENGIAPKVIAMDINKGPLERAMENIKKNRLSDKIEVRQSDGGKALKPDEVDALLIGGMGGALTVKILSESQGVVNTCKELVLQPQSEVFLVREYLLKENFQIIYEDMLIDDGKYYVIIKAIKGNSESSYEDPIFYKYGKYLLESKNQVLKEYLEKELRNNRKLLEELEKHSSDKTKARVSELKSDQQYLKRGLSYYEM